MSSFLPRFLVVPFIEFALARPRITRRDNQTYLYQGIDRKDRSGEQGPLMWLALLVRPFRERLYEAHFVYVEIVGKH
jgi:hypothetical protein